MRTGESALMVVRRNRWAAGLVFLVLGACASVAPTPPVPVEERGDREPVGTPAAPGSPETAADAVQPMAPLPPPETGLQGTPTPGATPRSAAVLALVQRQEAAQRSGDNSRAAAELERALRINPEDADLWLRLARIRVAERRFDLAESLAQKGLAVAGSSMEMNRGCWLVIAEARAGKGDEAGAALARARAAGQPGVLPER